MTTASFGPNTLSIHAGEATDPTTNALNTPIYQTATFAFDSAAEKEDAVDRALEWEPGVFFYSRTGNPTTYALEQKLAALEGAEDAAVGASGMAACATALLAVLETGDHCIASADLFVITRVLLDDVLSARGIEVTHVDVTDLDAVAAAVRPNTKALFIESLSNPHMDVADLPSLAALSREHGLVFVVDNTFLSPRLLRPLEHGADLVVHSATKWLGGHGDAVAGVVAGRKSLVDKVRFNLDALGAAVSPFNSWLILRGMRTLGLRMNASSTNALAVAQFLESRPEVALVSYPGLPSHPHHDLARKLLPDGYGGMMAIRLHGDADTMGRFAAALELSAIAVSLGDVHTLVYPMPKRDNLIRLSIGCEDTVDLIADYAQALDASAG
ncbi:PLP-dependent aspartate aminotransferase family protein [Nocardioides carbamazepini]|uniref:trans-sulfuration enzyme family protein n=1 Tax=Nocardioides carbamazepini TaxID=2854259 RepID=UPI00214A8841|nr:PLP-dependent aspartate aminotransferase family protein [Nocardioides carbamazepini]MCR1782398.1 PLP-dependent aspartate aminotransferase family protein [Nocardioides carbamazepini]